MALVRSINPGIEVREPDASTVCVTLGLTAPGVGCPTLFVGSHGWTARLGQATPVGSHDSAIPFGVGAAACFAVANVFRMVFRGHLPDGDLDEDLELSLLTYARPSA